LRVRNASSLAPDQSCAKPRGGSLRYGLSPDRATCSAARVARARGLCANRGFPGHPPRGVSEANDAIGGEGAVSARPRARDRTRAALFLRLGQREGVAHEALQRGPLGVGWRAKPRESGIFPTGLEQAGRIVELSATVEEERRIGGEGANPDDVLLAHCVAGELPH